jgi:hypothetical protein
MDQSWAKVGPKLGQSWAKVGPNLAQTANFEFGQDGKLGAVL